MQEIKEQPTTESEATGGLMADALRAEAWAGEPFIREGEDPAKVLAPATSRRRALDDALAEIEGGRRTPSSGWKVEYGLMLGLERVLAEEKPHLASGTELRRHQIDALAGMLTELIASHEKEAEPNGNGVVAEVVDVDAEAEEDGTFSRKRSRRTSSTPARTRVQHGAIGSVIRLRRARPSPQPASSRRRAPSAF